MFDELTSQDINKMQEELDYRISVVRKDLHDKIVEAKEFGDLSENAEYHETRRAKSRNEGRIEYLREMIRTAKIIEPTKKDDTVSLLDKVEVMFEDDNSIVEYEISTTVGQDASNGKISKESPFGKAIIGKKVGDRVLVKVNDEISYYVVIKSIKR